MLVSAVKQSESTVSIHVVVTKLFPTLCDLMDCSPPSSLVRGISQARVLEWVAISFSRGSSPRRGGTRVSCIAGTFFTTEPSGKPIYPLFFGFLSHLGHHRALSYTAGSHLLYILYIVVYICQSPNSSLPPPRSRLSKLLSQCSSLDVQNDLNQILYEPLSLTHRII